MRCGLPHPVGYPYPLCCPCPGRGRRIVEVGMGLVGPHGKGDPSVGRPESKRKEIKVQFNRQEGRFEVCVQGQVRQAFKLETGLRRSCMDACGAYWTALEEQSRCPLQESGAV